jgi:RNA polymerase sigma-70 factor (ECF subfamily)
MAASTLASPMSTDFGELFREEGAALWRLMYGVTGGRAHLAEEAVAEAFARAIRHADTIREPGPWIYRTALRYARLELSRERRSLRPTESEESSRPGFEDLDELMAALRQLSPGQRATVILHYVADLPVSEVAKRVGASPTTVRVQLHRGRRRLRELLGGSDE